ncbi:MAG: zf-HC2 domain-containing protein [Sarcina sp.]
MRNDCDIVQDLLPNYIENICSDPTNEYIKRHLETCITCKETYELMNSSITLEENIINEKKVFSKIKNKHRKQLITGLLISIILSLMLGTTLVSNFTKLRFNTYLKTHYPQYGLELSNFRYEDMQTLGFGTSGSYIADVYATDEKSNPDLKFTISTKGFLLKIKDNYNYQIEQTKMPTHERLISYYEDDVKYTLISQNSNIKLESVGVFYDSNTTSPLDLNAPYTRNIDTKFPISLSISLYSKDYDTKELAKTINSVITTLKENNFNPALYNFHILNKSNEILSISDLEPNYNSLEVLENIIIQNLKENPPT